MSDTSHLSGPALESSATTPAGYEHVELAPVELAARDHEAIAAIPAHIECYVGPVGRVLHYASV